tara:strand:- start:184 stop:528 length:345 start_codon:yes stop_codon:yes gene_type:complete
MSKNSNFKYKSVTSKLKDNHNISDKMLVAISNIPIEDVIALKFELSAAYTNNKMYGFDIWKRSDYIIKEAILKFAISATKSKKDAARFLGITYKEFIRITKFYKVNKYFTDKDI